MGLVSETFVNKPKLFLFDQLDQNSNQRILSLVFITVKYNGYYAGLIVGYWLLSIINCQKTVKERHSPLNNSCTEQH